MIRHIAQLPTTLQIGTLESLIGIGVMLVALGIAWGKLQASVTGLVELMNKRFEHVEKRFEMMDRQIDRRFEAVDRRFDAVDKQFAVMDRRTNRSEDRLDTTEETIAEHSADITGLKSHTQYGVTNSPTVPNTEGKKLLADSGFTAQYPQLKPKIFAIMDRRKPRTLYDSRWVRFGPCTT